MENLKVETGTVIWGSEAIRMEHEAHEAERVALIRKFSNFEDYSKEMNRLNGLLRKYKHRWSFDDGREPSQRMCGWVDQYNTLARSPLFSHWCDFRGKAFPHDAYDVLS